jgi:hypothetical protein
MNDIELRKQMALEALSVEYLPVIQDEEMALTRSHSYPLSNLSALGVGFEPLVSAVQSVVTHGAAGGSGIYHVNTKGLQMFQSKQGIGYVGSLATEAGKVGGGQALMTPLACDPTMMFMAAALMNIEKKLDTIQELQQEMMDYLKAKEKAKLRGDLNVLNDIMNNYKFNWDNEKYKTNKHILVQDIRKEAEQSIQLFRDQIQKKLAKKGFLHGDQEVKTKLQKLHSEFKDYQLALYLFSYSGFLEIMLLENFSSQYLSSVTGRIDEYTIQFRELYTACYDQIESMSKSSVESMLVKGIAGITSGAGRAIAKIPLVSKGPVDEALISAGDRIDGLNCKKTEKAMRTLVEAAASCTTPFVENIKSIDRVFNQPMEVYFDKDRVYFLEAAV